LAVEAQRLFEDAVADLNVIVNYLPENHEPLPQISDYVESIRISLWDSAFFREFNAEKGVHKNNTPEKQLNFGPALKRVVYRYFKFVLFPAQAISKSPAFFTNYKDIESESSMYTQGILKSWSTVHLEACGWYLDCPLKKPPSFEIALRDSLEPSLKSLEPTRPSNIANDTSKKPKEPKPKQPKQKEPKRKAIIVECYIITKTASGKEAKRGFDSHHTNRNAYCNSRICNSTKEEKHVGNHRATIKVHIIHGDDH
jgi:hypothetical protein